MEINGNNLTGSQLIEGGWLLQLCCVDPVQQSSSTVFMLVASLVCLEVHWS